MSGIKTDLKKVFYSPDAVFSDDEILEMFQKEWPKVNFQDRSSVVDYILNVTFAVNFLKKQYSDAIIFNIKETPICPFEIDICEVAMEILNNQKKEKSLQRKKNFPPQIEKYLDDGKLPRKDWRRFVSQEERLEKLKEKLHMFLTQVFQGSPNFSQETIKKIEAEWEKEKDNIEKTHQLSCVSLCLKLDIKFEDEEFTLYWDGTGFTLK